MGSSSTALTGRRIARPEPIPRTGYLLRQGVLKLLAVKDSDIRILTLEQCRDAVDKGLHAGGAFSAVIPLTALYYGGFIDIDVGNPTRRGQDLFTLSKGHAVAAMAAIYADLGYFGREVLRNSRSYASILNGHPGPILPGVHIATGPMGQGFGVAQGFAIAGRVSPRFDSYCMCGDGELQEGPIWEAVMFAGAKKLDNLCLMVDRNYGQLDIHSKTIFPMPDLAPVFRSFGWQAFDVDATQYDGIYTALEEFRDGPRNGKPTAIVCGTTKGYGSLSDFFNRHKVAAGDSLLAQELTLQSQQREDRVAEFGRFYMALESGEIQDTLANLARGMHLELEVRSDEVSLRPSTGPVALTRVPSRTKKVRYDASLLPRIDRSKEYAASDIVTAAMKVFARDPAVVSVDSDLASTSGLEAGVAAVDQRRALNVGVAEANMMLIGEAFAALGCNTWISTFCPFYDWKVLRRSRPPGTSRSHGGRGWLVERRSRAGLNHAGHGVELRDAHQRRHPHGERRLYGLRRHRPPEDRGHLLPATDAGGHEVDHGGESRIGLRPADAHRLAGDLWPGLQF
jgi:transketolase N-terminal domain/subunit